MLLFNGQPQSGLPTLQVFTRVQASNPSTITCANPATNSQGNATILLTGVYKPTTGLYGKILDVQHITQSASFPLTLVQDDGQARATTRAPGVRRPTTCGT